MDIVIKYKNVCSKREARSAKNSCAKTREDVSHHAVVLSSQQIGFRKLLSVSPKVEYLSFQWIFKTFVPFRISSIFHISRMDLFRSYDKAQIIIFKNNVVLRNN